MLSSYNKQATLHRRGFSRPLNDISCNSLSVVLTWLFSTSSDIELSMCKASTGLPFRRGSLNVLFIILCYHYTLYTYTCQTFFFKSRKKFFKSRWQPACIFSSIIYTFSDICLFLFPWNILKLSENLDNISCPNFSVYKQRYLSII